MSLKYNIEMINKILEESNDTPPYSVSEENSMLRDMVEFIAEETNLPVETVCKVLTLQYGVYLYELTI